MNLYIRVKDGVPFEHPIFEDNFRAAFPDVDINNLPEGFARFVRVPPMVGVYQVYEGVEYQKSGDFYTDVHNVRSMTAEEIAAKKQATQNAWAVSPNWSSWTFNAQTCSYEPPVAKPDDGNSYRWDEATISWVAV